MPSILFIGSQYTGGGIFMMRSFSNKSILFIAILLFLFIVTSIITLNPPEVQAANFGRSGLSEIKYMWLHSNGNIRAIDKYGNLAEFNYLTWTRLGNIGGGPWGYDPIGRNFYYFYAPSFYDPYTEARLYNIDSETITKYPNLASLANSAYNSSCRIYNNRVYKLANIAIQGTNRKYYPRLEEYDLNGNLLRQLDITDWQYKYEYESYIPFISGINTNNGTLVITEDSWGPLSDPPSWKVRVVNLSNLTVSYSGSINSRIISPYWEYGIYRGSNGYTYQTVPGGKKIGGFTHYDYRLGICSYGIIASGETNSSVVLYLNSTLISDKLSNVVSAYCRDKFGNHFVGCVDGSVYTLDYQGNPTQDSTFYSDYMTIDAAAEARLAKEAALTASLEAKQAKEKTNEAIDLINSLDTKFSAQLNIIQEQMQPVILSVKTTNGATATTSDSINIVVTAINASQYRYRVNNGAYSDWQASAIMNISSLVPGVNVIEVQAINSLEEGAPISSGFITLFRL